MMRRSNNIASKRDVSNYSVCHEIFIAKYVQRIELLFDLFLCIGLPVIQIILCESIKID